MPLPHWLARLTLPVMLGVALVAGTGVAAADATNDGYLAQLRALGFTWPPEYDDSMIGMGYLICDDLTLGWTPDQISGQVHADLDARGVTFGQVSSMVHLAHQTYCPDHRCWFGEC
jgi:Protein of unknown function (DUF732)